MVSWTTLPTIIFREIKKRPALEKFVDEAFPLVAVNLEQFA